MSDITQTVDALDARHTELVTIVGTEHRIARHAAASEAFDQAHPYADTRGRERHLEALDAKGVQETSDRLRAIQQEAAVAHRALSQEWATASTALTESERLERQFTATQLTLADRQTAKLLDETRQSNFRGRLAESTLTEVEGWYREALQQQDGPALRFLEEQAVRRFPTVRRAHPHVNAAAMGRLTATIEAERNLRALDARPDLLTAREKLGTIQTSLHGIASQRALTPLMSFDQLRATVHKRSEQAQRRHRDAMLTA